MDEPAAPATHTALRRPYIWTVSPPTYVHVGAYIDLAEGLSRSFAMLGLDAPLSERPLPDRTALVLGAHLLHPETMATEIPPDAVVVNLEPLSGGGRRTSGAYRDFLIGRRVLDYSTENVAWLQERGGRAAHLSIGYSDVLERALPSSEQDIDVLFYGSITPHRREALERVRKAGLKLAVMFGIYGPERDRAISRSKVVLNVRTAPANPFEIVRVAYLLNNRACVVSEHAADAHGLEGGVCLVPYEELAAACRRLVDDDEQRWRLSAAGSKLLRTRPQMELLKTALDELARRSHAP